MEKETIIHPPLQNANNFDVLQSLLSNTVSYTCDYYSTPLFDECLDGNVYMLKRLLYNEKVDPSENNNQAIRIASSKGHFNIVKVLLNDSRVDPCVNNNFSIKEASDMNYLKVVHILIKDPRVKKNLHKEKIFKYIKKCQSLRIDEAKKMIPFYSQAFYEKYQLPDDIMHVILGEFTFGYTTKECSQLLKCI